MQMNSRFLFATSYKAQKKKKKKYKQKKQKQNKNIIQKSATKQKATGSWHVQFLILKCMNYLTVIELNKR